MKEAIATPTVEVAAPVAPLHDRSTVPAAGICYLDDARRPDSPSRAEPAIADNARTDGTNVVATRWEHELPGAPSCASARVATTLRRV